MPAIYAHRAFGEDLKKRLPPERFAEVFAHPDCFALGLHGPDTLFYFHPLGKNAVNLRGEELHKRPAREFFFAAAGHPNQTRRAHCGHRLFIRLCLSLCAGQRLSPRSLRSDEGTFPLAYGS